MGNGPGLRGTACSTLNSVWVTVSLSLGPWGLEGNSLGLSALLAHDRNNQPFLGLRQHQVWAEKARQTYNRLKSDKGRNSLVDGACSQRWWE